MPPTDEPGQQALPARVGSRARAGLLPRDPWMLWPVALGAAAAVFSDPRGALLPLTVGAACVWLLDRRGDRTGARLMAVALAARFVAAAVIEFFMAGSSGTIFPDEADYLAAAGTVLDRFGGAGVRLDQFFRADFGYLAAPVVAIGGRSIQAIRLASAVAGAGAVVALWRMGRLAVGRRAARRAAALYAVFPSAVLWTSVGLKDGAVALLFLGSLALGIRWIREALPERALPVLLFGLLLLGLLEPMRESLMLAVCGALLVSTALAGGAGFGVRLGKTATALVCISLVLTVTGYGPFGRDVLRFFDPGYLNDAHRQGASAGSAFTTSQETPQAGGGADAETDGAAGGTDADGAAGGAGTISVAKRLIPGFWNFMARPYPFERPKPWLTTPDVLLWYAVLAAAAWGGWRALVRFPATMLLPCLALGVILVFLAATESNVGTAYRHRASLLPLFLLLATAPRRLRAAPTSQGAAALDGTRVALVLPTLNPGGSEAHVLRMARALRDAGAAVTVAAFRGGRLAADAEDAAGRLVLAEKRSKGDLTVPLRLARAIGRQDLVSTYLFSGNLWGGAAARLGGAALVSNVRTTHPRGAIARLVEPVACGETVLVNSSAVAREAARRGIDPAKLALARNGLDATALREAAASGPGRRQLRHGLGIDESGTLILVPGRIDRLKNQALAIEAFALTGLDDARLVFAGPAVLDSEKAYLAELEDLSEPLGETVRFIGQTDEMPAWMAASDIVLLTSEHEGLPTAALEAMALGRVVVATRAGGTQELVADGESGVLVARGDSAALARALRQLAYHPDMREAMGEDGARRAAEVFSAEIERDAVFDAFVDTLSRAAADDRPDGYEAASPRGPAGPAMLPGDRQAQAGRQVL